MFLSRIERAIPSVENDSNPFMKIRRTCYVLALAWFLIACFGAGVGTAFSQGTAFTYQGLLQRNGAPANGICNIAFSLYSSANGGLPAAGPVTNNAVLVTNGQFTVTIDFGSGVFTGETNWLEISVESSGETSFTTLTPRQNLTPAPYAIYAESANGSAITNLNVSSASGTLPLGSLPSPVVTNGQSTVTVGGFTATNYAYVGKWLTNDYNISTNDTVLFCWGTNETLTLPPSAAFTKMFTVFSKNSFGSVILTNSTGSQTITAPGVGQVLSVYLGGANTPSNAVTVMFDGMNY
jgi:hypothetical protein